jgi:hypothetical protein
LRAADLLAEAEQCRHFRDDLTELAKAYLRLAEQADRNAQVDQPSGLQEQQSEPPQQQQPQPSGKPAD